MKRIICLMLSLMMLAIPLTVFASAGNTYEGIGFKIDLDHIDNEWESEKGHLEGYDCTLYTCYTPWYELEIVVTDENPEEFLNTIKQDLASEGLVLEETEIDGNLAYTCEYEETGDEEYLDNGYVVYSILSKNFFAFTYNDSYGYYIELRSTNAETVGAIEDYGYLVDAIMNIDLSEKPVKSNANKTDLDDADALKNNDLVIIVAIVAGAVVILGVTAMVIFGKKKKQ